MEHIRDSLLGSLPRDTPSTANIDYARRDQEDTRQAVARGKFQAVREMASGNRASVITNRYCEIGDGIDTLETDLHSLWYMYSELGRGVPSEDPQQEGIILDILRMQGRGPLTRPAPGATGIDIARTVDGTLWNDLPFLASDMTNFWITHGASMSGEHRLNFATFVAKLASTRAAKDRLCQIALLIFENLLERPQELRSGETSDDEDPERHSRKLEIFHLLPAAVAWLREAGHNLVMLSDVSWNDCPSHISRGGEDFIKSDFGARSPAGFSQWRYLFWLKRLHEIQDEAKKRNEEDLETLATDGIDYMLSTIGDVNSGVIKVYKNGGDVLHKDVHLSCLKTLAGMEEPDF